MAIAPGNPSWKLPAENREAYWTSRTGDAIELLVELRELSAAREAADQWCAPASPPSAVHRGGSLQAWIDKRQQLIEGASFTRLPVQQDRDVAWAVHDPSLLFEKA